MNNSDYLSTPRAKKFRENKIKQGFKRVQKWVFDLEEIFVQNQVEQDLESYYCTDDMESWEQFTANQLKNIKGWKQ